MLAAEKIKILFVRRIHSSSMWMVLAAVLFLSGCGDFLVTKPTELESKVLLDDLSQIRDNIHVSNPLPEIYRQPPERIYVAGGVKLFYFARNHAVKELAALVQQQLQVQVVQNASTNQLVLFCMDDEHANMVLQYLEMVDVAPVQVNIDCLILERFGDITMDWETSIMAQNLMGENITLGEARATFDDDGNLTALDPAFPGASLRESDRSNFGLDVGYWINRNKSGHQVRAIVDMLISRGYLKILLNPQLETINGQKATVGIKDYAPIEKLEIGTSGASDAYNITDYVWVEDTLTVTPFVYADGSIGLTTSIKIGSRSKPEGVVQRSIITERSIKVEENRIRPGYSLVIGGMRKTEKRDVVRGVPFLKDIPLLGVLFSSRDFEEKGTEIVFILTPSISSGSRDYQDVADEIRVRYADPDIKQGLEGALKDPLGSATYTSIVEKEAAQAEMNRVEAELLMEQAEHKAASEKQLADDAYHEAEHLRREAERLETQAQKELQKAQKAAEEAQSAQAVTEEERSKAAKIEVETRAAQEEAETARKAAQQAQSAAESAAKKASQQESLAQQARDEANNAKAAVRVAIEEAERKAKQAAEEKARREAEEKARQEAEEKARRQAEERQRQQQINAASDPNAVATPEAGAK